MVEAKSVSATYSAGPWLAVPQPFGLGLLLFSVEA